MSPTLHTQSKLFQKILVTFKLILKERGLTYKDLAQRLNLTEGAVKKSLASEDMSFSRMMQLCDAAEISYFELVRRSDEKHEKRIRLSEIQEELFLQNMKTWRFFMDLLEMSLDQVRDRHRLTGERIEFYLGELEKVGLISRQGAYGFEFLFEGRLLEWNPDGKFSQTINRRIATHLLETLFQEPRVNTALRIRSSVRMTPETKQEMIDRLRSLSAEMAARGRREMSVYDESRLEDVTWILGLREFDVWGFLLNGEKL